MQFHDKQVFSETKNCVSEAFLHFQSFLTIFDTPLPHVGILTLIYLPSIF